MSTLYETDNYMTREITAEEYNQAVDGDYHKDNGIPANYVVINKQTDCIEFYSSNLPNALNLCNRFDDAVKKESGTEEPKMH